jgi:hypothetical protein
LTRIALLDAIPIQVQDSGREIALAALFGLLRLNSRIGVDAVDLLGRHFELKTTTKSVVSTARDFGPNHIEKWKNRYWIIARGINLPDGFKFNHIYFLSRCHMDAWYNHHMIRFYIDTELTAQASAALQAAGMAASACQRIDQMCKRGMKLNDPGIAWSYVCRHGIAITENHAQRLQVLIDRYPIGEVAPWGAQQTPLLAIESPEEAEAISP